MKNEKRKFPLFFVLLTLFLILAVLALHLVLGELKKSLAEYEKLQPDHLAAEIFDTYFKGTVRFSELLDLTGYSLAQGETKMQLCTYLESAVTGEITYQEVFAADDDHKRYVVTAGEEKIAAFELARGENAVFDFFGHEYEKILWLFEVHKWSVESFELFWEAEETITVYVPANSLLLINGILVDERHFTGTTVKTDSCSHMPDGVTGLIFKEYHLDGFLYEPSAYVYNHKGEELLLAEADDGALWATIRYDMELESRLRDYVLSAVQAYACFMQEDMNFGEIKGYFDPTSDLYENIRTTERFVWEHDRYEFRNVSIGNFYAYDENTISCSVSFTHVLHKGSSTWSDTPLDQTVYLRLIDGVYQIYKMVNN